MSNRRITYKTQGTCSQLIDVEVDDNNRIVDVSFVGGCNGNLQGICSLVRGMSVEQVKSRLDGIRCGYKPTSCPDQLCRALDQLEHAAVD
jgi:uncharacterized protein (TIGR03905 family)